MANMLAFWLGGMAAGITVGIAALVLMHNVALVAIRRATSLVDGVRSAAVVLTGDGLPITLGVLSLLVLAVLLAKDRARLAAGVPEEPALVAVGAGGHHESDQALKARKPNPVARLATLTQDMLESGGRWPAFAAGLASTFPPVEGPMALAAIMASKSTVGIQLSAFVVFTMLVLTFVELPLLGSLVAPRITENLMLHVNQWIQIYRRQIVETAFLLYGLLCLGRGLGILNSY